MFPIMVPWREAVLARLRQLPWRKILGWSGLLVAAAVVVAAGIYVVFWPLSDLIASHDVGTITGPHRAAALQTARDAARGRLVTLGAGLFAAGALLYTARNFTLSRRTFELTEQGQVTDRYTKAIEQLGSDKPDVRIGGIYALERIARDSPRDHSTVMEVLTTFVREHSGEPLPEPGARQMAAGPPSMTRPDVQTAVTVIGRRNPEGDRGQVNLQDATLPGANLGFANLTGARLEGANLRYANLTGARLEGANLGEADLTGADLSLAYLNFADLDNSTLTDVTFNLANLAGARLYHSDLTGTDLTGTDLTGVNLGSAELTGALLPPDVEVPPGWQRDTDSGRLARAETASGDAAAE